MRITRRARVWLFAALLLIPLASWPASAVPGVAPVALHPVHHVVIMSFDGVRADAARMAIPASMLTQAAFAWTARTILPSSTLPAHTSMLTGVPPSVHGVRINPNYPRGHIAISTVFSVVTENGGRAAAFVAKPKLLYLVRPGTAARAEYVPYPKNDSVDVAREAARYLAMNQPHLLFIHVADPDDQGHSYGWMSPPYMAAVRRIPETVGVILDVLRRMGRLDDSLVIVTSDHGGHGRVHGSARSEDMIIPWLAFGAVEPGPIDKPIVTHDTAATAIAALGMKIPTTWQGTPVLQTVDKVR